MRKTDKKLESTLITALTEVCNEALEAFDGFQWLTHFANYSHFPDSLIIVCVFDTNEHLEKMYQKDTGNAFRHMIKSKLESIGIRLKNIHLHVKFETEEACKKENDGRWNKRFNYA